MWELRVGILEPLTIQVKQDIMFTIIDLTDNEDQSNFDHKR
jgi:hypothetical protein